METQKTTIFCIGLINSSGVKFPAKCWFELERKKTEYFYYSGRGEKRTKCYLGYPVEMYEGKAELHYEPGQWFIKRQCFETINAAGKKDVWYDNEKNMIVRVSKYGKKQWENLKKQAN